MKSVLVSVFCFLCLIGCSSSSEVPKLELSLTEKVERANLAYDEARLDRAESLYLDITQINPQYLEAWLKLGNIYVRQMRLKAAKRCFEEAIKINQEDGRAWYNLALVRVKQALNTLETAEQVVPIDSNYQQYFLSLHQRLVKKNKVVHE